VEFGILDLHMSKKLDLVLECINFIVSASSVAANAVEPNEITSVSVDKMVKYLRINSLSLSNAVDSYYTILFNDIQMIILSPVYKVELIFYYTITWRRIYQYIPLDISLVKRFTNFLLLALRLREIEKFRLKKSAGVLYCTSSFFD
jgi:hypothetical protein